MHPLSTFFFSLYISPIISLKVMGQTQLFTIDHLPDSSISTIQNYHVRENCTPMYI